MTNLTCASGVDLLMEYLEDTLPVETRTAIEAHVSDCPRCMAFLESYRETPRILRDATAVEMPPDLEKSLLAAVRAARKFSL